MDVKMPVMNGEEATRRILAEMPRINILALSIYDDEEFLAGMMRAGARGFILKGCDSEDLCAAIRSMSETHS
jgi:DNA-binding NarL/FixJ family response regulator